MTSSSTPRPSATPPEPEFSLGLRLRLWLACLGGALVTSGGVWWVVGTKVGPGAPADPEALVTWLLGSASVGIVAGAALALWLDGHVLVQLRGLSRGVASGQVPDLAELPASSGWGELSELTRRVQALVTGHREAARAAEMLRGLEQQLERLLPAAERWGASERWEPAALEGGPLAALGAALDRGFTRDLEVREQNQEAARLVQVELEAAVADAREAVEQAEQGFVEATALLTTVRELQRLGGELQQALASSNLLANLLPSVTEAYDRQRAATALAIEELVAASTGSVEHLAQALARARDIADQVHLLANRATLIALNALVASGRERPAPREVTDEVKSLAREVREATTSTDATSGEIEVEIAAAAQRMKSVRERVAAKLEQIPPLPALGSAGAPDEVLRLHERVREMIQDATRKGERVLAAGERASRAAHRFVRRLEEEAREMEGLVVRLAPPASRAPRVEPTAGEEPAPRLKPLRLLEPGEPKSAEPAKGREGRRGARLERDPGDRGERT